MATEAPMVYLVYLYLRHPQRVTEVGLVHLDAEPAPETATSSREPP